jgi:hypothetical protein
MSSLLRLDRADAKTIRTPSFDTNTRKMIRKSAPDPAVNLRRL